MKTVNFEKTLRGLSVWLLSKSGYLLYLLCTGLPILFYIVCLFLMAVKREASITLSIIMAALINPLVSIPLGISAKTLGQFLLKKLSPKQPSSALIKVVLRLFTYSLNCHLTLIAGLTYYLFAIWIDSEESSDIDFTNKLYDQCTCDILTELHLPCENRETETSFQNRVIQFSIPLFLQTLIIIAILCHIVHAMVLYIPSPLTLIDLILGVKQTSNSGISIKQTETVAKWKRKENLFKALCGVIAMVYMVGIASSPYYGFNLFLGSSSDENGNHVHDFVEYFKHEYLRSRAFICLSLSSPFPSSVTVVKL